jgi:hypothetical protein
VPAVSQDDLNSQQTSSLQEDVVPFSWTHNPRCPMLRPTESEFLLRHLSRLLQPKNYSTVKKGGDYDEKNCILDVGYSVDPDVPGGRHQCSLSKGD